MSELADKFEIRVNWEPFLLRPNTPAEGTPKSANFSDPNNPGVQRLKQAGRDVGIDFAFKAAVTPNTLKAHALLELAKEKGKEAMQNDMAEQLFEAYFTKGQLLDEGVLLDVAKQSGMDQSEAKAYINDDKIIETIKVKASSWSEKGVSGIPFFYMNGQSMFSGAQDVETFKRTITMASEKFPTTASSESLQTQSK